MTADTEDVGTVATAQEVAERIRKDSGSSTMAHLASRVAALTEDQEIEYADWIRTEEVEGGRGSGIAVVFTGSQVIVATAVPSEWHAGPDPDTGPSTVAVRCWSRRTLKAVSIEAGDGDDNADGTWMLEWRHGWPQMSKATLHYEDQDPLTLPLSQRPTGAYRWSHLPLFMASVLAELDREP